MVGCHYRLFNGHEFEQALGDGEGQGSLVCRSPWGHKESDMTERLNNNKLRQWSLTGVNCCNRYNYPLTESLTAEGSNLNITTDIY